MQCITKGQWIICSSHPIIISPGFLDVLRVRVCILEDIGGEWGDLLAVLAPYYTGRFIRAEEESRRRELGDEGDAAWIIPRMRLRPHPSPQPPPPLRETGFFGQRRKGGRGRRGLDHPPDAAASPPILSSTPAPTGNGVFRAEAEEGTGGRGRRCLAHPPDAAASPPILSSTPAPTETSFPNPGKETDGLTAD
jgi:hypothetical protein